MILLIILTWIAIGGITSILYSIIKEEDLTYSDLILECFCGIFLPIILLWLYLDKYFKLPKWMYKKVIENIRK